MNEFMFSSNSSIKHIGLRISLGILYFLQNREYFGSFCRGSPCDQVRHLYYKIRSSGPLPYTTISTSGINSIHQVGFLSVFLVLDLDHLI